MAQLESMLAGGELAGVRLEKGGDVAKLHSAADKGTSCIVRSKVGRSALHACVLFQFCQIRVWAKRSSSSCRARNTTGGRAADHGDAGAAKGHQGPGGRAPRAGADGDRGRAAHGW